MKTRRRAYPTGKLVPLQDLYRDNGGGGGGGRDHDHSSSNCHRQLAVLPPAVASGRLSQHSLPDGWIVEEVRRPHDYHHIDKYYHEEETGLKFRSLQEVRRYLNGEEVRTPRSREQDLCSYTEGSSSVEVIKRDGEEEFKQKQLAIVNSTSDAGTSSSTTNLPSGWIIERVPRKFGGYTDKYYYEPGTGQKFRSRVAVFKHLQELEEDMTLSAYIEEIKENISLSKAFKLHRKRKDHASSKRNFATSNGQASSFVSPPPKKIKWILGSTRGDVWYPFNFEEAVSESVKQQWNQKFMAVMMDDKNAAPKSGKSMHF